jgi:hypothetical protein
MAAVRPWSTWRQERKQRRGSGLYAIEIHHGPGAPRPLRSGPPSCRRSHWWVWAGLVLPAGGDGLSSQLGAFPLQTIPARAGERTPRRFAPCRRTPRRPGGRGERPRAPCTFHDSRIGGPWILLRSTAPWRSCGRGTRSSPRAGMPCRLGFRPITFLRGVEAAELFYSGGWCRAVDAVPGESENDRAPCGPSSNAVYTITRLAQGLPTAPVAVSLGASTQVHS